MGGAVDSIREALQRYLDKLEGWAVTNCIKFNMGKSQIQHLGQDNLVCMDRLVNERLERALEVLADGKVNMSWQCVLAARNRHWNRLPRKVVTH